MVGEHQGPAGRWIGPMLAQSGIALRRVFQAGSPGARWAREQSLPATELPLRGRLDLGTWRQLRCLLRDWQPHIVHSYTGTACWLTILALWPRKTAKLVLFRGAARKLSRWSPSDSLLFYKDWVDAYDCISAAVARSLVEAGVPASKTVANLRGVKPEWYASAGVAPSLPPKPGRPRIGCVANYRKAKGLETLVEAADVLRERGVDFELVLVGRDDGGKLAGAVARAKSRDRIQVIGWVSEAWRLTREFQCLVVPSLQEGMGFAALEALACGAPLVASAVGGLLEVVEDGQNGLLVPPASPGQLADAIQRLLGDPLLRERLRHNGFRTIEGKLNLDRTRDRLLDLYARLAGGQRNAPS